MNISKEDLKKFNDQGFLVIKSNEISTLKDKLTTYLSTIIIDAVRILNIEIDTKSLIGKTFSEQIDFIVNTENNNTISSKLYELFPSLTPVISLLNNDLIVNIAKGVGIRNPVASTIPLIRIDRPKDDYFATPMHQDYWYSMLSDNSIVIWLGLVPIISEMGLLGAIPESHKKGLVAFRNYEGGNEPFTTVDDYNEDINLTSLKLEYDEILVFNQYLLHISGKNISNRTRVSMQIRFNDLESMESITSGFTAKSSTFVINKQKSLVKN